MRVQKETFSKEKMEEDTPAPVAFGTNEKNEKSLACLVCTGGSARCRSFDKHNRRVGKRRPDRRV